MPLTNSQYQVIMREYDRKQAVDRSRQADRRKEVYERIPQMKALEGESSGMAVAQARLLLSGDKEALPRLKTKIADIKEQKEALLGAFGFPADYMEMQYHCPLCQDTGYAGGKKCRCFKQAEIDLLYTQSNMKEVLEKENFETFREEYFSREVGAGQGGVSPFENMQKVTGLCRSMIEGLPKEPMNLMLTGPAGTGKTFLTHCIARELLNRYQSVIYLSAGELFETMSRNRFDYNQDEEMSNMGFYILEADMLIIDDLGTELTNTFTVSQLFHCINERAERRKSTIISTNLTPNGMRDLYTERIFSRIVSHYRIVELFGEDIRIKKLFIEKTT